MRIWFQVPKKHFLEPLQIESPWEISILRGAFFWAFSIVILVVNSIYKCWHCILTRLWTTSVGRSICEIHRFANCIYLCMLRLLQVIWVGNLNFTENFSMLEVLILWVWESTKRLPMSLHGIFMLCHYKIMCAVPFCPLNLSQYSVRNMALKVNQPVRNSKWFLDFL